MPDAYEPDWLDVHLNQILDEMAAHPEEFWPRLTGSRADKQEALVRILRNRAERLRNERLRGD